MRKIAVLSVAVMLLALWVGAASASTVPAWMVPEGKVEVWVPVIFDENNINGPCYRVDVPDGVDGQSAGGMISEPDKTRPNYGKPLMQHTSIFVAPDDVERVTTRIAEADVPIADRMIVEIGRAWPASGKETSDRVAASTRCMNFFSTHADLWAQEQYKELGRTCLRVAGRRLAPGTITALKELYEL